MHLRRASLSSLLCVLGLSCALLASAAPAQAATYPSPPHDFGPIAGAHPLYNAANAATSRPLLIVLVTFNDMASPAGFTETAQATRVFGPAFPTSTGTSRRSRSTSWASGREGDVRRGDRLDGVVTVDAAPRRRGSR